MRLNRWIVLSAIGGALASSLACDDPNQDELAPRDGVRDETHDRVDRDKPHDDKAHDDKAHEADNTVHNKGDADASAKTPFDQSNAQADITVTADIRKAILGTEGLSMNADNVKVITSAEGVAVRGVVASQAEIDAITKIVAAHAGTRTQDIQLSIDAD